MAAGAWGGSATSAAVYLLCRFHRRHVVAWGAAAWTPLAKPASLLTSYRCLQKLEELVKEYGKPDASIGGAFRRLLLRCEAHQPSPARQLAPSCFLTVPLFSP